MKTNIIFLDIDGVITSGRTGYNYFDLYAVRFINWICAEGNCKIVISSTWRYNHDKAFFDLYFQNIHTDWSTPDLLRKMDGGIYLSPKRGIEIDKWLDDHKDQIENYLILDDDSDMTENQLKEHFIKTNTYNGLLFENYIKIVEFFKIKKIPNMNLIMKDISPFSLFSTKFPIIKKNGIEIKPEKF